MIVFIFIQLLVVHSFEFGNQLKLNLINEQICVNYTILSPVYCNPTFWIEILLVTIVIFLITCMIYQLYYSNIKSESKIDLYNLQNLHTSISISDSEETV